jgi:hypothetical protein
MATNIVPMVLIADLVARHQGDGDKADELLWQIRRIVRETMSKPRFPEVFQALRHEIEDGLIAASDLAAGR